MITRSLELKDRIDRFSKAWLHHTPKEKVLVANKLKVQHWKQLDRIQDALSTFEVATMDSQGNCRTLSDWYPTISFILDTIDGFKMDFASEAGDDPSFQYISDCCDHAWHKVEKYYKLCDKTPILFAAVYLNPLLKKQWFDGQWTQDSQAGWSTTVHEQVIELWREYKDTGNGTTSVLPTIAPTLTTAEDSVHSRMRNYKRLKTTHRDNGVVDELTEYLTSDPLPDPQYTADGVFNPHVPPFDVLQWWFERRRQWPNLSRMAFDCLSVPLMSDNPERSFSAGRDMITYRRSQLGSDIIEACAFLRSVYGPPVRARAGTTTTIPAFDDEVEVEKDMENQRQQQQSFQQSFVSTTLDSQSQSEDLYG
jgi:hypothetical protein